MALARPATIAPNQAHFFFFGKGFRLGGGDVPEPLSDDHLNFADPTGVERVRTPVARSWEPGSWELLATHPWHGVRNLKH